MGSENRVSSVPVWFQCWIGQYMEIIRTLSVHEKWKRYSDHMTYCYYLVHAKMHRAHIINKLKKYITFCVLFYLFRCISNTILHRLYFLRSSSLLPRSFPATIQLLNSGHCMVYILFNDTNKKVKFCQYFGTTRPFLGTEKINEINNNNNTFLNNKKKMNGITTR